MTALAARGTDEDEPLPLHALASAGAATQAVSWDDAGVDWSCFDIAVLRSTWDYAQRHGEFVAWCRRTEEITRLVNPARVVAWNADKTYLRDLAGAGVPVVSTTWVALGQDVVLPEGEVVVEPSVSAGSRDTARHGIDEHEAAIAHVAALGAAGPTEELFAPETITATIATAEQHAVAEAALSAVPFDAGDLAHARVDLVADETGHPVVLELELIEPSLFLTRYPAAAGSFARVLLALRG